jgi:hypothetical protein
MHPIKTECYYRLPRRANAGRKGRLEVPLEVRGICESLPGCVTSETCASCANG